MEVIIRPLVKIVLTTTGIISTTAQYRGQLVKNSCLTQHTYYFIEEEMIHRHQLKKAQWRPRNLKTLPLNQATRRATMNKKVVKNLTHQEKWAYFRQTLKKRKQIHILIKDHKNITKMMIF